MLYSFRRTADQIPVDSSPSRAASSGAPIESSDRYDVIVVGAGNAALCAAMAARHLVPRVLLLERAPQHMRGGNTRHTRNIRCAHDAGDSFFSGPYPEEEMLQDLMSVSGCPANLDLAKFTIRRSRLLPQWMGEHGVAWQQPLAGTLHLGRTNRWFLGGGKALVNTYFQTATRMGIAMRYDAMVEDLLIENGRFEAVVLRRGESDNGSSLELIRGGAVVVAAGGYEANLDWLKRHWGPAADNFLIRGTPYNDGTMLAALLRHGAQSIGDPKGFHAIAIDARAPKFDGGIVSRLDCIPFGIVVNRHGCRFYDEGEDFWPKRYAIWGGLIAGQPDQLAYCLFDAKTIERFLPPAFRPYQADTIAGLAAAAGIDPQALALTVDAYNRATAGNSDLIMDCLDGNSTRGLTPPKSHWALPIDTPPFWGYPLRPGITFTYHGVMVNDRAQAIMRDGRPARNIFAAGEIMAGNILGRGYLAGFGLTIGTVFGRIAGKRAACHGNG